jgi:nitrite reductase/ring-hydroxylating ferredoxin subunit
MSSYDSNYRKIAALDELQPGKPRVFRAAGATLVMRRTDHDVSAIDGSCLAEVPDISSDERLRRVLDCVESGTGSTSAEWEELHARAGLPVRVEAGEIWVCVEACRP